LSIILAICSCVRIFSFITADILVLTSFLFFISKFYELELDIQIFS
jgi:hypothetical protein